MFDNDIDMANDMSELIGCHTGNYDDWSEIDTGDDDYYDDSFLEALADDLY